MLARYLRIPQSR